LNLVSEVDMGAIKDHILEIKPQGSTNMAAGMKKATEILSEYADSDQTEYENRIIFLTDAMPNTGETDKDGLLGMTKDNADNNMYTTFIGIGVDFNTELIEYITKIKGSNYYSVHSPSQFKTRLDDEFEYMVTPLVFDLELNLVADGYDIEKVYGSPEADEATGEIMRVNTLFPSAKEEGETKGGLVLLKLKKTVEGAKLHLFVSYQDRQGASFSNEAEIDMNNDSKEYFANLGIHKGVLLARYADLMKNWMVDEREAAHTIGPFFWRVDQKNGIAVPTDLAYQLGKWERQSSPLVVSEHYQSMFVDFYYYFSTEMDKIGDDSLKHELDIIEQLRDL